MFATEPNSYIELLQKFPPRPIKSEADLLVVQEVIDAVLDSGEMTPEKQDYINVLGILVHEYEEKHVLPMIIEEFTVKDWQEVESQWLQPENDPVFGETIADQYRQLAARVRQNEQECV